MECKAELEVDEVSNDDIIGIYPEWNVKLVDEEERAYNCSIGIYPEWNVKTET